MSYRALTAWKGAYCMLAIVETLLAIALLGAATAIIPGVHALGSDPVEQPQSCIYSDNPSGERVATCQDDLWFMVPRP